LPQKILSEFVGTALIVAAVVGPSFMLANLGATPAVGLLAAAIVVAAVLFVVIEIFGPISGAHFNPAVSLVLLLRKELPLPSFLGYLAAQFLGAVAGAAVGNLMFERTAIAISSNGRFGFGTAIGEILATFGLVLLILLLVHFRKQPLIAAAVAAWILAGHLTTSSTSFANPAVSLGRVFTESAAGIGPSSMLGFWLFQILGALLAVLIFGLLTKEKTSE
jgi:glycerol uptake facilitator-like aquaporin